MHAVASCLNTAPYPAHAGPAAAPSALRELTSKLARGDDLAWEQFHRDYGPMLFRQLLAATRGDHDLASEALQQAYLRIARHVRPCDVEPMFIGWLRIVARTALSDCRRRRLSFWQLLRRRREDPSDIDLTTTTDADEKRLQNALDQALRMLDPADRALLENKYLAGHSVRAIAERMELSTKAVESRLTRARAELRHILGKIIERHE